MTKEELDDIAAENGEATPAMTLGEQQYLSVMRLILQLERGKMLPKEKAEREKRMAANKLEAAHFHEGIHRQHSRKMMRCDELRVRINKGEGCPLCEQLVKILDGRIPV